MAVYDDYGRTSAEAGFGSHSEVPEPYVVDAATAGVTYICFADAPLRCIRRITQADGVSTTEFTMGDWALRTELTVWQPVNTTMEA